MHYHHLGIPTDEPKPGETYVERFKMYVTSHDSNPYGIQWMRFAPDCTFPDLVKTVPHVAFRVANLEKELDGRDILIEPNSPSPGVMVAFIVENGAPVEFLQIDKE